MNLYENYFGNQTYKVDVADDSTTDTVTERLITGGFLVENEVDELVRTLHNRQVERLDKTQYHVIVNPTLDCNLNCWYCYENRIAGSQISDEVIQAIIKNFSFHYSKQPYDVLKLSFFGGEPLLFQHAVRAIISGAADFCNVHNIKIFLDITTNATLITTSLLDFLSPYSCQFQITLDGNELQHNKIKFFKGKQGNPFSTTVNNIHRIQQKIPNAHTYVRINFDKDTLDDFDGILSQLLDLDRKRTTLIMKKIWQVDQEGIPKSKINDAIYKLLKNDFVIDYYGQGGWCFADMDNEVTINYDGKIFRCTTISKFDDTEALGKLDYETGQILWDPDRIAYLSNEEISERCLKCKMLPSCGGPCRRQMSLGYHNKCFLDDQGITIDDYALIHLQINWVKHKVYGK